MSSIENKNRFLLKNTVVFAIGNIGTKLINFLMVPLYTGILSREEYGTVDLIYTMLFLSSQLVMLNMQEGVLRFSLDSDADYDKILSASVVAFMLGIFFSLFLVPIVEHITSLAPYSKLFAGYVFIYSAHVLILSHIRGQGKLTRYTFCSLLTTFLITVLNIYFLVYRSEGILGYLKANILAYTIMSIVGIVLGRQYHVLLRLRVDWVLFRKMAGFSLSILPGMLAWWAVNSSDRIMITHYLGEAANGLYAASSKLPTLVTTLGMIFLSAWPYSAVREKEAKDDSYSNYIYDCLVLTLCMISAGLLVILKPLMRIYVASAYYDAWRYSPCLILGGLLSCLGTFLATAYYVRKDNRSNSMSSLFGAGMNILLNMLLIPRIGIQGASVASLISFLFWFFYRAIDTKKYLIIRHNDKKRLITVTLLLLMSGLVYLDFVVSEVLLVLSFVGMLVINRRFIQSLFSDVTEMICKKI